MNCRRVGRSFEGSNRDILVERVPADHADATRRTADGSGWCGLNVPFLSARRGGGAGMDVGSVHQFRLSIGAPIIVPFSIPSLTLYRTMR